MGGIDKAFVPLAGRPLIAHIFHRLAPQQKRLAINAGGDPARFAALAVPVWPDAVPAGQGPLAGVLTGLTRATEPWPGTTHVLTVPVDCPLLPVDLVDRMTTASQDAPDRIVVAESAGRLHGTVALWPISAAAVVRQSLTDGMRKLAVVQQQFGVMSVQFPYQGLDPFTNLNTPQDLALLERGLLGELLF